MRHTAASLAISAGANVKAVQRMLGHASAAVTLDGYSDLIWPILLHASTDPTLFLFAGHPTTGNPLIIIPSLCTYLVIVTGVILLIAFVVSERRRNRSLTTSQKTGVS